MDEIQKEVTYKVKLDNTDLAQQLQSIRDQIDQALVGQSFGSSFGAPPSFSTYSPPISIPATLNQGFTTVSNSMGYGFNSFQNSFGTGFQTINNSLNMTRPTFSAGSEVVGGVGGPWSTLAGTYGFGYDPNMPFSRADYQAIARNNLYTSLPDIIGQTIGGTVGGIAGSVFPGIGNLIGGTIGTIAGNYAIGGVVNMAVQDIIQNKQTADYINLSLLRRGALAAGQQPGARAADIMQDYFGTQQSFLQGTNRNQFEEILAQFTNQGGFDTTRTTDEYLKRFNDLLADHKKIMHTLRITQEQAVQFMSEMQRSNLIGSTGLFGSSSNAALTLQSLGGSVGITGSALGQFGMQSIGLGLQEIPGMSTGQAFTQGIGSLLSAQSLARQGLYTNDLLARTGGVQNIAASLQKNAYDYASTGLGQANLMSPIGMTGFDAIGNAMGKLNSWEDMIAFKTGYHLPEMIEARGINNINVGRVVETTDFFRNMGFRGSGEDGKFTIQQAIQQLMLRGVDRNTAEAMVLQGNSKYQSFEDRLDVTALGGLRDIAANQPGGFDRLYSKAQELGTGFLKAAKRSSLAVMTAGATELFWYSNNEQARARKYGNLIESLTNVGRDYEKTYDVAGLEGFLSSRTDSKMRDRMNTQLSKAGADITETYDSSGNVISSDVRIDDRGDVIEELQSQRKVLETRIAARLEKFTDDKYYGRRIADTGTMAKRILSGSEKDKAILDLLESDKGGLGSGKLLALQQEYQASLAAEGSVGITEDLTNYLASINKNFKGTSVNLNEVEKLAKESDLREVYSDLSGETLIKQLSYHAVLFREGKTPEEISDSAIRNNRLLKSTGLDKSLLNSMRQNIDYSNIQDVEDRNTQDFVGIAAMTGDNIERAIWTELRKLNDTFGAVTAGTKKLSTQQ